MEYKVRPYYCPLCGTKSEQGTNHIGSIAVECKTCKHGTQYCDLPEAHEIRKSQVIASALLTHYRYSMDNPEEKEAYEKMVSMLTSVNFEKLETEQGPYVFRWVDVNKYKEHEGKEISITYEFGGSPKQYVSSIGRVYDWEEFVYPNKNIKAGYYIELI